MKVFGEDESDLSKKKVVKYQKELRTLMSAARVALMGLDDATEEIRASANRGSGRSIVTMMVQSPNPRQPKTRRIGEG